MTKLPVLDDNTRDANVIGEASDSIEAANVFMAYMRERMDADDFAELERPTFEYRNAHGADFREIAAEEIANGFFEPMF